MANYSPEEEKQADPFEGQALVFRRGEAGVGTAFVSGNISRCRSRVDGEPDTKLRCAKKQIQRLDQSGEKKISLCREPYFFQILSQN